MDEAVAQPSPQKVAKVSAASSEVSDISLPAEKGKVQIQIPHEDLTRSASIGKKLLMLIVFLVAVVASALVSYSILKPLEEQTPLSGIEEVVAKEETR